MATTELASGKITWVDVINPSTDEMEQLSRQYKLNQYTVLDCLQPEHLPKYEFDEDTQVHFLILRFCAHASEEKISSIQDLTDKIAIFCTDKFVITIHLSTPPFLDPIARSLHHKNITTTILLSKIIWQALETFDSPAFHLSEQLDVYEDQMMLKKPGKDATKTLFYIKRHAAISLKVLMLMLEPINHVHARTGEEASIQDVRDQHLKMQTLYSQVLEDVNNLLALSMSFAAQRTNEVMRILTIFSVFFLPLTFIVGIYGMNFDFMPELKQMWGYPGVVAFMVIVTVFIYIWFRRKKWL